MPSLNFTLATPRVLASNQFLVMPATSLAAAGKSLGSNSLCVLCLPTSYRTSPSCLTSTLNTTMPAEIEGEIDTGPHEPAAQPVDIKTSSKSDKGRPAILNKTTNVTKVHGGAVKTIKNITINDNRVVDINQANVLKEMVRSTDTNRIIRELISLQESIRLKISTRKQPYPMTYGLRLTLRSPRISPCFSGGLRCPDRKRLHGRNTRSNPTRHRRLDQGPYRAADLLAGWHGGHWKERYRIYHLRASSP